MSDIPFNINETVKVKLTPEGLLHHKKMGQSFSTPRVPYVPIKVDARGYSEFQLWHLMELYGEHLHMGCPLPFETNIILVSKAPTP